MLARLQQLQAKVTQFGELANRLAEAVPRQAEGSDPTGRVRVVLGGDGLPTAISVRDGWDQRVAAAELGAAVVDANADALRQGMAAFSQHLDDTRWWAQRARIDEDGPQPAAETLPRPPDGRERDPGELTEDVLKALHTARQPAPARPAAAEGTDPQRYVTVTLGPGGLTGCAIDPGWAARRDGEAITAALAQALRAAKDAVPAPAAEDLNGLLGDALATLRAITEHRPTPGGTP